MRPRGQASSRDELSARLARAIPGGAHTYSRGVDQFPANAPALLTRGEGAYVWDSHNVRYLDYGMGLRSVTLGYAYPAVTEATRDACASGVNLTLPTLLELEVAEEVVESFPSIEMVKFARHGSVAATAAVRLARAATGRDGIAVCRQHPFHSFDDWFIGSTPMKRGTARASQDSNLFFDYGDAEGLSRLLDEQGARMAAVILEPGTGRIPCPDACAGHYCLNGFSCRLRAGNFLHRVRDLCDRHGVIMILDEVISGLRWHSGGAQSLFGVRPDLTILGKALGNGFAISALGGAKELMELGGIDRPGAERVFLLSSTHGSEAIGLAAARAVLDTYSQVDVCSHIRTFGASLKATWTELAQRHGLDQSAFLEGPDFSLSMRFLDSTGAPNRSLLTVFQQEMARMHILMPWVAPSLAHSSEELDRTAEAIDFAFGTVSKALRGNASDFLLGPPTEPVFRQFN